MSYQDSRRSIIGVNGNSGDDHAYGVQRGWFDASRAFAVSNRGLEVVLVIDATKVSMNGTTPSNLKIVHNSGYITMDGKERVGGNYTADDQLVAMNRGYEGEEKVDVVVSGANTATLIGNLPYNGSDFDSLPEPIRGSFTDSMRRRRKRISPFALQLSESYSSKGSGIPPLLKDFPSMNLMYDSTLFGDIGANSNVMSNKIMTHIMAVAIAYHEIVLERDTIPTLGLFSTGSEEYKGTRDIREIQEYLCYLESQNLGLFAPPYGEERHGKSWQDDRGLKTTSDILLGKGDLVNGIAKGIESTGSLLGSKIAPLLDPRKPGNAFQKFTRLLNYLAHRAEITEIITKSDPEQSNGSAFFCNLEQMVKSHGSTGPKGKFSAIHFGSQLAQKDAFRRVDDRVGEILDLLLPLYDTYSN